MKILFFLLLISSTSQASITTYSTIGKEVYCTYSGWFEGQIYLRIDPQTVFTESFADTQRRNDFYKKMVACQNLAAQAVRLRALSINSQYSSIEHQFQNIYTVNWTEGLHCSSQGSRFKGIVSLANSRGVLFSQAYDGSADYSRISSDCLNLARLGLSNRGVAINPNARTFDHLRNMQQYYIH